jgi:hypothetical protein
MFKNGALDPQQTSGMPKRAISRQSNPDNVKL